MKKFDKSMVGKKVRFVDKEKHEAKPEFYPPVGTIGEVKTVRAVDGSIFIQWPKGTTSDDDKWWVYEFNSVELVEEPVNHMTDAEVFKMLEPKLEKNGLNPKAYFVAENHRNEVLYSPENFEKAVALAYRAGYGRGQKGRLFEYQNVKAEPKKEEDKLVGKKVVLANPDEMDIAHGFHKGIIGTVNGSIYNSDFIFGTFNYHSAAFHKSKLMLIVDDEPKKGDKVVFLDEADSEDDPEFFPPVGTILDYCADYCGNNWYYTSEPWDTMSEHWKEVMNKNHNNWGDGLYYGGSEVKKVIPLC